MTASNSASTSSQNLAPSTKAPSRANSSRRQRQRVLKSSRVMSVQAIRLETALTQPPVHILLPHLVVVGGGQLARSPLAVVKRIAFRTHERAVDAATRN